MVSYGGAIGNERLNTVPLPELPPVSAVLYRVLLDKNRQTDLLRQLKPHVAFLQTFWRGRNLVRSRRCCAPKVIASGSTFLN